jgi:transcriptional regulator with XRE-family HTH domain
MKSDGADTSFAERFRKVIREYGSTNSLATAIGRSEGALRNWLAGRSEPTVADLRAICDLTHANVEWLVTGRESRPETEISGVRDSPGVYTTSGGVGFDERLLRAISETVEQELAVLQTSLTPGKKAEIVVNCYHFIGSFENFDPATVTRLVKLAC